jgi:hypothetical protein
MRSSAAPPRHARQVLEGAHHCHPREPCAIPSSAPPTRSTVSESLAATPCGSIDQTQLYGQAARGNDGNGKQRLSESCSDMDLVHDVLRVNR